MNTHIKERTISSVRKEIDTEVNKRKKLVKYYTCLSSSFEKIILISSAITSTLGVGTIASSFTGVLVIPLSVTTTVCAISTTFSGVLQKFFVGKLKKHEKKKSTAEINKIQTLKIISKITEDGEISQEEFEELLAEYSKIIVKNKTNKKMHLENPSFTKT
jgi:hypothetical protein